MQVKKPYEPPKVVALGTLHELTQKTGPLCDVSCYHATSVSQPG
jgi:hypothetical protein